MSLTIAAVHEKKAEITGEGEYFEVEQREIAGRSFAVYKHAPATLLDVLQSGRNHGDQDFLVYQGRRYSFTSFYADVDALAAYLQDDCGVKPGDRIAIAMRNCPEWGVGLVAASLIGAVVVPINSWGKAEELSYAINDCDASLLIADQARHSLVADELSDKGIRALVVEPAEQNEHVVNFEDAVARGQGKAAQPHQPQETDDCLILYTSGSTGFPKGVVHRHIGVTQSLMNMMWLGYLVMSLEGPRELKGGAEREAALVTVPWFHATGLLGSLLMPLQMGQKAVLMYKWDAAEALKLISGEKVTMLSTVPAIVLDLLGHPDFDATETSSLIRVTGAGAATPDGMPELIDEKCDRPSRSAGWGMTETMAVGGTMSGAVFDLKPTTAGIQSPIIEMKFVDDTGADLPPHVPGELKVRGITCTTGYWNKPEANQKTFDAEGWMETGDIAVIDEDVFLSITGRIKEIVIRGGENIYPGEIENVAYRLDAVQENVVFGIPDADMGEEMVMVAYVPPGRDLTTDELRAHLASNLAGYKVPKEIRIVHEPLPRNASEKLHKLKVKEQFLSD